MHVLIVGLGKSGQSVLTYAERQGWQVTAFDTRQTFPDLMDVKSKWPKIPIYLQEFPMEILATFEQVIVSPGVSLNHPVILAAKEQKLSVIGDIELFVRVAQAPIIAITGSNGKSTVTTLVTELINASGKHAQIGGNIGLPSLSLLDMPIPDYYVLELSSFQLETTFSLQALVATVLNISPDHLDRHGSLEAYQAAKERIYDHCHYSIINRATHYQREFINAISFGLDEPMSGQYGIRNKQGKNYLACGYEGLLPVAQLSAGLSGLHNQENALAALALIAPLKLPLAPQLALLQTFQGLPHRCQKIRELAGVTWINDSKGTNIASTLAALNGLGEVCAGKIVLIAGGQGKGADFTELNPAVKKYVRAVLVFGQDADKIAQALVEFEIHRVKDLVEAIQLAKTIAISGDYVLLSPACASLDMFRNYEHRGQFFINCVTELH